MSRAQDLLGLLRGIQLVAQETLKTQKSELKVIWSNSSVRTALEGVQKKTEVGLKNTKTASAGDVFKSVVDGAERVNAVLTGVKYYATNATPVAQTNFIETAGLLIFLLRLISHAWWRIWDSRCSTRN